MMNKWVEKPWGRTKLVSSTIAGNYYITGHFLEIKIGGYSSVHAHRLRDNLFVLITGKLLIISRSKDGYIKLTILNSKSKNSVCFTVAKNLEHAFVALSDCKVVEKYNSILPADNENDIYRISQNGICDPEKLHELVKKLICLMTRS